MYRLIHSYYIVTLKKTREMYTHVHSHNFVAT